MLRTHPLCPYPQEAVYRDPGFGAFFSSPLGSVNVYRTSSVARGNRLRTQALGNSKGVSACLLDLAKMEYSPSIQPKGAAAWLRGICSRMLV